MKQIDEAIALIKKRTPSHLQKAIDVLEQYKTNDTSDQIDDIVEEVKLEVLEEIQEDIEEAIEESRGTITSIIGKITKGS